MYRSIYSISNAQIGFCMHRAVVREERKRRKRKTWVKMKTQGWC